LKPVGVVTSWVAWSSGSLRGRRHGIEREQHLGGELAALFEDLIDGVGIDLGVRPAMP
jgi:hypothetical protein